MTGSPEASTTDVPRAMQGILFVLHTGIGWGLPQELGLERGTARGLVVQAWLLPV